MPEPCSIYLVFIGCTYPFNRDDHRVVSHKLLPMRFAVIAWIFFILPSLSFAQTPSRYTSADIREGIKQLNVLGSVLYVAAHPDDENTRLISWLVNEKHYRTTYISLTRGDGGQNLIGPELAELLGLIRTQELLAARRIDGGRQMFSRANDFGFSKHPDETLRMWNKDEVLADLVWTIRLLRPDVIINRFDHRSPGRTHGHHTASAMLAVEAFDLAGNPNAYPEQLKYVEIWQPKRLFFNTSWWFYGSQEAFDKADKTNLIQLDIGAYYPSRGKSNNEIAAESRSQHQCQGMGSDWARGSQAEYLEWLKGDPLAGNSDLFAGVSTDWSRIAGGSDIGKLVQQALSNFDYDNPAASVPALMDIREKILALPEGFWKKTKLEEVENLIQACMGLYLEAVALQSYAAPGQAVWMKWEAINRSGVEARLEKIEFLPTGKDTTLAIALANNQNLSQKTEVALPTNLPYSTPYWLSQPWETGMYTVPDQSLRGLPETPRQVKARFHLTVLGKPLVVTKDIAYKSTDPVKGERYQPFEILPIAFVSIQNPAYVFASSQSKQVVVTVTAGKDQLEGKVRLDLPRGWRCDPPEHPVSIAQKEGTAAFTFNLSPPAEAGAGTFRAVVIAEGQAHQNSLIRIQYDHIPVQTVLREAASQAVRVNLEKAGEKVAYIMGAGDEIPGSLEQIGYQVDLIKPESVQAGQLAGYDAVILGIRIYNTLPKPEFMQKELLRYVENGGTLIVQYNTTWDFNLPAELVGPYPLKISRDRVTVEDAEVRFLQPDHELLHFPNQITAADFEGWVQERGLYFPDTWDEKYQALLSCNDPGEKPRDGGLLVCAYGKGHYIYTGYSWFRQLPAGVPGAYRLFANMISIGKNQKP